MGRLIRHELLDLPPHRTVPAVLDGVVRAPRQGLGDVGPARAAPRVAPQDDLVLGGRPGQLADVGVQLVVPPLPALLARAARQVRREDGPLARAVALDRAQQELVLGGGPGALDLRGVGCVVWGGSVPGGAPKKCRGRRRSQRARECGSPRRAVRRVCWGRGLSRPRDSWRVRDLTGGGVWKERRAGQKAAPPAPAALRSRRRAVCAAGAADGARLGPLQLGVVHATCYRRREPRRSQAHYC